MRLARGAAIGLNALTANFGPALLDGALLDALCRALGLSFFDAMRTNAGGLRASALLPDLDGFDFDAFLGGLRPAQRIAARHTVGLVDLITDADRAPGAAPVADGLPETLEEVVTRYRHRWFKLKVGVEVGADVARLSAIAAVLDRSPDPYFASLDGNEQYDDVDGVLALWAAMRATPRLARLASSVIFVEQPIRRHNALARDASTRSRARSRSSSTSPTTRSMRSCGRRRSAIRVCPRRPARTCGARW